MLCFPQPLVSAQFVIRPNRFVIHADVGGELATVRCPSPGRMEELLTPNVELLVHAPDNPDRRTDYTLVLIRHQRQWISIDTQLPNRLFRHHLETGLLPMFADTTSIQREVPIGASRIDFLLERRRGKPRLVEVKCCNLVDGGHGLFPDSPSHRASRHLRELILARQEGFEPWVVFMITRVDAQSCGAHALADPLFAETLTRASKSGVRLKALTHRVTRRGIALEREVPVLI